MAQSKKEHQASYRPMPDKNRFWLHAENCYTDDDLIFREWILKIRTNSGIDKEYLTNPSSWFAEDSQALINAYENSWIYSTAFKTRHILTRDDFHVQPVASERLQWPELYDLMQNVGDYLLIRNQNFVNEHLNQPMNFFFLDINFILNRLSQNPNMAQVKHQLEVLNQYVRTIEKNVSPTMGTDRLFLANFRQVIDDKIDPQLTHMIESQLLKDRLGELSKTINKLSTERNRVLHFALNINPVNPHPYGFSTAHPTQDSIYYPTQAAKKCGSNGKEISTDINSILKLTVKQLSECPNFKLISMDEDVLSHYAAAISDLNELDRFQNVITQIMDLLGQAGEVYTIHQFKEQMVILLKQIEGFIDDSSQHVEAIIQANTMSYLKAIQIEQDLSFWKKWLTYEKEMLKIFIKNQDTLAQFPSSTADLIKTNKELKGHVTEVISHLSQPRIKHISFEGINGQAQELNKLMSSMHGWIKNQYEIKGLTAPPAPEALKIITTAAPCKISNIIPASAPLIHPSSGYHSFFASNASNGTICSTNDNECQRIFIPPQPTQNLNSYFVLGVITLIPLGILILYLLINWNNEKEDIPSSEVLGSQEEFEKLTVAFDDLLTIAQEITGAGGYEDLLLTYDELKNKSRQGIYDIGQLQEIYDELMDAYQEAYTPNPVVGML